MIPEQVWLGSTPCPRRSGSAAGGFTLLDDQPYSYIDHVDRLAPFLMTVVSASDLWLFVCSNGPFTAGRADPDGGLFPYQTVDKIMRHPYTSGSVTALLVHRDGRWMLWEPWRESSRAYGIRRRLCKHVYGTAVVFEETNTDLELCFRWGLTTCDRYGLVRECSIQNLGPRPVSVRYLDGWQQMIPPGVSQDFYARYSYLSSAYTRHERPGDLPMGVLSLSAAMGDSPDPRESLRMAAAWSIGHPNPVVLLCDRQVEAFRRGEDVHGETAIRGELGAFAAVDEVTIAPGGSRRWILGADTGLDDAAVVRLCDELQSPDEMIGGVRRAVLANTHAIRRLIGGADGLQHTADRGATAHHFANVLFNCMRGGTFASGYAFPRSDLVAFIGTRSKPTAARHAAALADLPEALTLDDLHRWAATSGDPQLVRLAREYLPLTFSRRHGDPSRPWNHFHIRLRNPDGSPAYAYQGNWRDILQNWESLAYSFPQALDAMVSIFLNASTADGYNPYRITRDGVDWEVHNPYDPWSHFGYWGDHQIVYLLRLLEALERHRPGLLASRLRERQYAYAHVPYEIAGLDAMLANPRHTIRFNAELHERLMARARAEGADGKLLRDADGGVLLVTLAEKLLVPLLAKLSNLVPEGGIWLNTQRPEWNDANNALAGWGLSVVTAQYLRRYLAFLSGLLDEAGDGAVQLSASVVEMLSAVTGALERALPMARRGFTDEERHQTLVELGRAGEWYRSTLYREGLRGAVEVPLEALRALVRAAIPVVEQTIRANRRDDGLYHGYNVLQLPEPGRASIKRLYLMLEGQVAALSSGLLTPQEAVELLSALRQSDLYRPDQHSYILYPNRQLPPLLERNVLPSDATSVAPLLRDLVSSGDRSLVVADPHGVLHFQADLCNASDVSAQLDRLAATERWREAVQRDRQAVLDLWERVFHHTEFTGRSGTFFMFEGLGSIYWHMVAKLLVAVQESWRRALEQGAGDAASALADAYDDVRDGLGFRKSPEQYGAFPTDPYSHTPAHRGAQQPGMTGQVKEEILTRWGELGVEVAEGQVRFRPRLLHLSEFFGEAHSFAYVDVHGQDRDWPIPSNALAFTYCQVPVCYRLSDAASITVERADGCAETIPGGTLAAEDSQAIFARNGAIASITVDVPRAVLRA